MCCKRLGYFFSVFSLETQTLSAAPWRRRVCRYAPLLMKELKCWCHKEAGMDGCLSLVAPLSLGCGYYTGSQTKGMCFVIFFFYFNQNWLFSTFLSQLSAKAHNNSFLPNLRENPNPPTLKVFWILVWHIKSIGYIVEIAIAFKTLIWNALL